MKNLSVVTIQPPSNAYRTRRNAKLSTGKKKTRYDLPEALHSASPVGYRTRLSLSKDESDVALSLLSLHRPKAFEAGPPVSDGELFDESALGVLSSRQSTNFRGFRQVTFGPGESQKITQLLGELKGQEAAPLSGSAYTHIILGRKYRNPFTMLLTLVGHRQLTSPFSVLKRVFHKRIRYGDDIPTIGYLPHLHIGILADGMDRAALIASQGKRRANVMMQPFSGRYLKENRVVAQKLAEMAGQTPNEKLEGWQVVMVSQVGYVAPEERIECAEETWRRIGATMLAFRSERIQPGVNQEAKAPPQYQLRQSMDVSEEFVEMTGRAAYNAFEYWSGLSREVSKSLLILDRVDVLTPDGKARLRAIRGMNEAITDRLIKELPLWSELMSGRQFSKNAEKGRKAFALAGQRIYIGGLSKSEISDVGLDWSHAVRVFGAATARAAFFTELMGSTEVPDDCDLLAGICLMAGPVNQNDIGKTYYGIPDLLAEKFGERDPTSLLVWTLKAKTVADPLGNEEQLMNRARKGALVDLRPGPHEVIQVMRGGQLQSFRKSGELTSCERAFSEQGNFVVGATGEDIVGNRGEAWPDRSKNVFLVQD